MFKEFGILFIMLLIFLVVLQWIQKYKKQFLLTILSLSLIIIIIASLIYNLKNIFPNYNYENVSIGDCKENLLTYKSDSQFQWQILFPILQNREVQICDEKEIYKKFMELYARDVKSLEIENQIGIAIEKQEEWSLSNVELSMFLELDYVFPEYYFDQTKGFPKLWIKYDGLSGSDQLVAYVDKKDNLYLMSKDYFDSIR